ncbi:MAG: PaaI family thioesterase [Lachnospiraceae bacterium]|nr:PaaI family thioesterase [Lachnospiraceae bacterium]
MTDLEYAREFFAKDLYATATTGIIIEESSQGHSRISLKTDERHKNALGYIMGGVYMTMADFAFAVASNFNNPSTVTLQTSASFLSAARGSILYATADLTHDGSRTCVYDINITDECGTDIAHFVTNGYKIRSKNEKTPEERAEIENPFLRFR